MNILVDGQTLQTPERNRGIGRYLLNTLEAMVKLDKGHRFFVLTTEEPEMEVVPSAIREKATFLRLDSGGAKKAPMAGLGPEQRFQRSLADLIGEKKIDLYWNPNPLMPNVTLPARVSRCAFVATVFDLIPLIFEERYLKRWPGEVRRDYSRRLMEKLPGYDRLLAISVSTKVDFIEYLGLPGDMIEVTHLGVDSVFFQDPSAGDIKSVREKFSLKEGFMLYTGGFDFRKNLERLVSGFSRFIEMSPDSELTLVVVCAFDAENLDWFNRLVGREGVAGRVVLTGYVTEGELVALYALSGRFIFPSLYEGFGLPVLEAMASGKPVAASAFSSVPEILGGCGSYFDPYDVEEIANAIKALLKRKSDPRLKKTALERAKGFTWEDTARKTLKTFEDLIEDD